jgi:hypothetical protein
LSNDNRIKFGNGDYSTQPRAARMSDVSREEIEARFEASEARAVARQVAIESKLDRLGDRVEVVLDSSKSAIAASQEARRAAINTMWSMIAFGVAMLGIAVAVMAYGQNMLSMAATIFAARH